MYRFAAVFDGKIWAASYDLIELFFLATTNLMSAGIPINPFEIEVKPAHFSLGVNDQFNTEDGFLEPTSC